MLQRLHSSHPGGSLPEWRLHGVQSSSTCVRTRHVAGAAMFPGPGNARSRHRAQMRSDRKSTRLNSSHVRISYAVFCLKKKKKTLIPSRHRILQSIVRWEEQRDGVIDNVAVNAG